MTLKRWEQIARELGDYEIVDTGYAYQSFRELVRVDDEHYVGEWVEAEAACKRIEQLEAALRQCANNPPLAKTIVAKTLGEN